MAAAVTPTSKSFSHNILSEKAVCLILLATDHAVMVELLKANAGGIDGEYLKREAEAASIFDKIKLAWKEARDQG